MGEAQPEIILAGQRGLLEPLQPVAVLKKECDRLLPAAQEMEGMRLPDNQIDQATVLLLGRKPLCMGAGLFQGRDGLCVGIDPGHLLGKRERYCTAL